MHSPRSLNSQLNMENQVFLRPLRNSWGENLCFANAAVCFLLNTPLINNLDEEGILGHLKIFLQEVDLPHYVHPMLEEIDRTISGQNFSNFHQHDSAELVGILLGQLNLECLRRQFLVQYSEVKTCPSCNHFIQRDDEECMYQMKSDYFSPTVKETLLNCLEKAIEEECTSCHSKQLMQRTTVITNAPETLILSAIRHGTSGGEHFKINSPIYPDKKVDFGGCSYYLRSVIVHKGRTPDSGHYFMLRVHPQDPNKFYKVDDSLISMIHGDVDV